MCLVTLALKLKTNTTMEVRASPKMCHFSFIKYSGMKCNVKVKIDQQL